MGKTSETKQGEKRRIGDQDISRCHSKSADSMREVSVVNSGSLERKKKKKRKHDSDGISDEFVSTVTTSENTKGMDVDAENKRDGKKKRKVEQDIDQEKVLDEPLEKNKKGGPEKGPCAFHLTNDGVTRNKYNNKDTSAYGDENYIQNESERLKGKKRKKEHKHNFMDDTKAGLGECEENISVPRKKKDYTKESEVGNVVYGDSNKKGSNMNKHEKKKHKKKECNKQHEFVTNQLDLVYGESSNVEKKNKLKMKQKGDNEVGNTDKLAIKSARKVRFADNVEFFPSLDDRSKGKSVEKDQLVWGKRFSPEEDELIRESIFQYIKDHELGENGLMMILHCGKYPKIRGTCWKEIGTALPWRPYKSVFYRAHTLFERSETRSWTKEEEELIKKYYEENGSDWKTLAKLMGKFRIHVKDTWRRIKLPNMKKGHWSQDEYQQLFDLVNMDLQMKALEEKVSNHRILRDNISWAAISERLSTRTNQVCCQKWYTQLTSPMVKEGLWADTDDYRLLNALVGLDACSMEEVDWNCLVENRSGELCRKRWTQMVRHIGDNCKKSFVEQVDILSERYCPDLIDVREAIDKKSLED
ncbi:hypothetical protein SAY87_009157 [Trapa incisa]|uniref:Uncharacterized protein n=1 Tax=Trapa incisa TaxID=236973 RepID=A0AAN7JUM3_9MYRT|nr:hypothetical protein SAY87_009157 [Trapa incisa]